MTENSLPDIVADGLEVRNGLVYPTVELMEALETKLLDLAQKRGFPGYELPRVTNPIMQSVLSSVRKHISKRLKGKTLDQLLHLERSDPVLQGLVRNYVADSIDEYYASGQPEGALNTKALVARMEERFENTTRSEVLLYNLAFRKIIAKPSKERTVEEILALNSFGQNYWDSLCDYLKWRDKLNKDSRARAEHRSFLTEGVIDAAALLRENGIDYLPTLNIIGIHPLQIAIYRLQYVLERATERVDLQSKGIYIQRQLERMCAAQMPAFVLGLSYGDDLSRASLDYDVGVLVEYAKVIASLNEQNPEIAEKATTIMPLLPLSHDDPLGNVKRYAAVVGQSLLVGVKYNFMRDALLDPSKVEGTASFVADPDKTKAALSPVEGLAASFSGRYCVTTDEPNADGDVQEKALQAYRYYGTELDLITRHIREIVRKLHKISGSKKEFDVTELGVGEQKLAPVLKGIANQGYKVVNVNLVDIDQRRIDTARDYLATKLGIPETVFNSVNSDFTRLEQTSLPRHNGNVISLTTFFGTTFCNQQPNTSLDFIKTRYALLGIYLDPENKKDRDAMVGEYETVEMREHTKHIGRDWGLTNQDLDERCRFGAQLLSVDWSREYGESFRDVKVIVPYFEMKEAIKTKYFAFKKGDRICGIRSYKYNQAQFDELLERHGFNVVESFPDSAKPKDGVKLYLVENTKACQTEGK